MKQIDIEDIAAHDDHTWDDITIAPITVVLVLVLVAQTLFGFGCVDSGDDPGCSLPYEEDCVVEPLPAGRGGFLPAGPCRINGVPCDGGIPANR